MKMLDIFFSLVIIAAMLTLFKDAIFNFGQSQPILSTGVVMVVAGVAWWFLVVKGPKPKSDVIQSPPVSQSATVSGRSTNYQAGRDINVGISESAMLKLLNDKANARDRELAQKYPLGCILLGVLSDGKIIYDSGRHSLRFNPDNDITIEIDAAKKIANINVKFLELTSRAGDTWTMSDFTVRMNYIENHAHLWPFNFQTKVGTVVTAYIEVLDESDAIFVMGFK
jgi:hypothetical protein